MDAPPVVGKHVEHAQDEHEERGRPLGLEPYRNHTARAQPNDRHEHPPDAPLSLNHESQKEEDEQDPTGKKEAANQRVNSLEITWSCIRSALLFLSVVLADVWKSSKRSSSGDHRVAKDHEQSTNHTQVAQEEVEVENESITEPLRDDNTEQSTNSKFGVLLRDDCARAREHSLHIQMLFRLTRTIQTRNDAR
jgi:hypothetical protein